VNRVEGIVIIEAIIDSDGRVATARVQRSSPLLDEAALEAVRAWEYTPTLLNGMPTAVIMTVTVRFDLK
jgi:protein TonB